MAVQSTASSTGDVYTLTKAERARLYMLTVDRVATAVADSRIHDVLEVCQSTGAAGCAGGTMPPPAYVTSWPFFEYSSCRTALPLMLNNSPRGAGMDMPRALVEQLSTPPDIVAIKHSPGVTIQVGELVQRVGDRLRVFVGYENTIVPAPAAGAHGVVAMPHQIADSLISTGTRRSLR